MSELARHWEFGALVGIAVGLSALAVGLLCYAVWTAIAGRIADARLARVREVAHHGVTVTGLAYRILEVHAPAEQAADGPR